MSAEEQLRPDEHLIQYLLGVLPENESEPLDTLSVSDDAFALRLSAIENDLIDSFVRGELSGESLNQFESFYLSTPTRREKLAFAKSLNQLEISRATSLASAVRTPQNSSILPNPSPAKSFSLASIFSIPNLSIQWGLAAASLVLLVVTGFLVFQNRSLRNQLAAQSSQANNQDARNLQAQLDEQSIAIARAQAELLRVREALSHPTISNIPAILLLPQTRGLSQPVNIAVFSGAEALPLQLALESEEFPHYRVDLKDPATDKTVWKSESLSANSSGKSKMLAIAIPRPLLKQQNYLLQLTGIPIKGSSETLSTYIFHISLK